MKGIKNNWCTLSNSEKADNDTKGLKNSSIRMEIILFKISIVVKRYNIIQQNSAQRTQILGILHFISSS